MIRTSWMVALLAGLAPAGVVWAQPTARPAERIVTIQHSGGQPAPCRIRKTWTTDEGHRAWLLQEVGSDMFLTVVDKGHGSAGATLVDVSIYPWGNDSAPPPGSPVPPREGAVVHATHTPEAPAPRRPMTPIVSTPNPLPAMVVAPAPGVGPSRVAAAPVPREAPHVVAPPAPAAPARPAATSASREATAAVVPAAAVVPSHADHVVHTDHVEPIHHAETPPAPRVAPGGSQPVVNPARSATYGYYPTQWRPYPGTVELSPGAAPPAKTEPAAPPKVMLP
jgi:hypothetical protein